jgi:hypothetical protein
MTSPTEHSEPNLFKYFGHEQDPLENAGLKVLDKLSLKATPPNEFNDPFEFSPVLRTSDVRRRARVLFRKLVEDPRSFHKNASFLRELGWKSFTEFRENTYRDGERLLKRIETRIISLDNNAQDKAPDIISEKFGVICFSRTSTQPLMWSHYGSSHGGLLIEFDRSDELFRNSSLFKVKYGEKRVGYDTTGKNAKRALLQLARRKSRDWSYEKEYRLFVDLEDTTKRFASDGKPVHLLPIKATAIRSVTFGLRTPAKLKTAVRRLLERAGLQNVRRYQVHKHRQEFKFIRELVA